MLCYIRILGFFMGVWSVRKFYWNFSDLIPLKDSRLKQVSLE